jgi:hypothetical protein
MEEVMCKGMILIGETIKNGMCLNKPIAHIIVLLLKAIEQEEF